MSDTKSDHGTRSSHDTHGTHSGTPARANARTAAPRDAAADQTRMVCLLAADWLNGDRTHAAEIAAILGSLTSAVGPPTNVDVPAVTQTGATLFCTMGNWTGTPTAYAYAWHSDGVANGATDPTYTVQPDDSGHSLACVVTATNALGSTAAPQSNAIAIA